jgi:hypothetical protein
VSCRSDKALVGGAATHYYLFPPPTHQYLFLPVCTRKASKVRTKEHPKVRNTSHPSSKEEVTSTRKEQLTRTVKEEVSDLGAMSRSTGAKVSLFYFCQDQGVAGKKV